MDEEFPSLRSFSGAWGEEPIEKPAGRSRERGRSQKHPEDFNAFSVFASTETADRLEETPSPDERQQAEGRPKSEADDYLSTNRQQLIALIESAPSNKINELRRSVELVLSGHRADEPHEEQKDTSASEARAAATEIAGRRQKGNFEVVDLADRLSLEPDLPAGPPNGQYWKTHKHAGETPPEFVQRVYGEAGWLDRGMSKRQLRKSDESLAIRLYDWLRENDAPDYLAGKLLNKKEKYDELLKSYTKAHRGKQPTSSGLIRLATAAQRRGL